MKPQTPLDNCPQCRHVGNVIHLCAPHSAEIRRSDDELIKLLTPPKASGWTIADISTERGAK